MDIIKIIEWLSGVAAAALTVFVIMLQRNISSENWFSSKEKMMVATCPFALISSSLGAYITFLVNMEASIAPIRHPIMEYIEPDAAQADRFTLLGAYMAFLLGLVTLKTGWSSGARKKTSLARPFLASLLAMNSLFLKAFWGWISAAPVPHFLANLVFYIILAVWFFASVDLGMEQNLLDLIKLQKELDILTDRVAMVQGKGNFNDMKKVHEEVIKRVSLIQYVYTKFKKDYSENPKLAVMEDLEAQVCCDVGT